MSVRSLVTLITLLIANGSAIVLMNSIALADNAVQAATLIAQVPQPQRQENWLKELNLSPDQLQKIREIRKQYQGRLTEERQAVRQAQQELNQLMTSNAPTDQIRQKYDQVQALKQKLGDTRLESMLAIRDVLNAEQRQKLNAIVKRQK